MICTCWVSIARALWSAVASVTAIDTPEATVQQFLRSKEPPLRYHAKLFSTPQEMKIVTIERDDSTNWTTAKSTQTSTYTNCQEPGVLHFFLTISR